MNILDSLKGLLTDELVSKAASALGEDGSAISKVMTGALPTVLGGLLNTEPKNHNVLAGIFGQAAANDNLMGDILGGLASGDTNVGGGIVDSLIGGIFGQKASGIINILTNLGGLKNESSSKSILGMVGTMAASYFGKKMMTDGFNFSSILNMIGQDKDAIIAAAPAGVADVMGIKSGPWQAISDVVGGSTAALSGAANKVTETTNNAVDEVTPATKSGMKWLWPLLLLAALALGLIYILSKGGCNGDKAETTPTTIEETQTNTNEDTAVVAEAVVEETGTLDADGNWVVTKGDSMTIKLDNGTELFTTKGSVINKLHQFVSAPDAVADKMKAENWFNFEDVLFKSGSSNLKAGAETQLKNAVAVLNAFPTVKVKLGGYTDNTGSEEANVKISKARAKTVYNKMISLGAQKTSFDEEPYEGYGPQYPVCPPNDTEECKAQNRRIAIVVTQK